MSPVGVGAGVWHTARMDDRYTHGHHDSVLRSHRWRTAENSASYLTPVLSPGMRLLDVGCGPGTLTADLADLVAPGPVVGLDRSVEVLTEAKITAEGRDNLSIMAGDVYRLGFPDGAFDVVHAHQVLQHLSDPVAALEEMARVCAPDGFVAVRDADYHAMTWWPADPVLDRWMEVYQATARANRAEPDAGRRLLSWAQAAGLTDIRPSASVWTFATAEDRRWWGDLWAERMLRSELARQAIEGGHADQDELGEISEGWRRWAAAEDGWFVVVHGEVLARPH